MSRDATTRRVNMIDLNAQKNVKEHTLHLEAALTSASVEMPPAALPQWLK
jgi:hypothetical protein